MGGKQTVAAAAKEFAGIDKADAESVSMTLSHCQKEGKTGTWACRAENHPEIV